MIDYKKECILMKKIKGNIYTDSKSGQRLGRGVSRDINHEKTHGLWFFFTLPFLLLIYFLYLDFLDLDFVDLDCLDMDFLY